MIGRVIALSLALVVAMACVSVNPVPTATPAPTSAPTAAPTATSSSVPNPSTAPSGSAGLPSVTATPGATVDPALAAQIDAVIAGMPAVRQLEATTDVPYEFITREQFQADLTALLDEDTPIEVRQAEERLYKRLGLLPEEVDMEALIAELYGSQVAAFYRPDTGRFYIIERDQPFGATDKIIVAHEYTHALQDQHFDLETNQLTDPFEADAVLGQLAVIEGDASLASQLWAFDNLTSDELFDLLNEALGGLDQAALADMPLVLRRQLEFPYGEGLVFVNTLFEAGGFAAVDAAIQDPPPSTEQILHPEKYDAREAPVHITPPGAFSTLLLWDNVYEQTVGELGIQILATGGEEPGILIPGLPVDWPHQEVAGGWGGDRLVMFEHPDGSWAIVWRTAWDSIADADEFRARLGELASTFAGPSVITPGIGPVMVQVVIASDESALRAFNTADF